MEPTGERRRGVDVSRRLTPTATKVNSETLLQKIRDLLESHPDYIKEAAQVWFNRQPKFRVIIHSFPYEIERRANPGTVGESLNIICDSLDNLGPKNLYLATDEKHKGRDAFIRVDGLSNTEAALNAAESFIFDLSYEISRGQRDSSE